MLLDFLVRQMALQTGRLVRGVKDSEVGEGDREQDRKTEAQRRGGDSWSSEVLHLSQQ